VGEKVSLELNTITFNHDFSDKSVSALNIRRNKDEEIFPIHPIPEYNREVPRETWQSCATYAITETRGQSVFIRVSFGIPSPSNVTYEVRAGGGSIMGELNPFQVVFNGTATASVDIPLSQRTFREIGRHDITWEWQYRQLGTSSWESLATTSHRIYLIINVPASPWTQVPSDPRNPWTDLLDDCCVIASGSRNDIEAAKKVTKGIYGLNNLRYDIKSGSPRYYVQFPTFELTNWIDYALKGNAPNDVIFCEGTAQEHNDFWIVNCHDCAGALTLMSKVVGAQVDYYYHGPTFGYLNYVVPIGRGRSNNPFWLDNQCQPIRDPIADPDAGPPERSPFGNHGYTKLNHTNNYDATMKRWVHPVFEILLVFLGNMYRWLARILRAFGFRSGADTLFARAEELFDRAEGWLIDLTQATYEEMTIDRSQDFEDQYAQGGHPSFMGGFTFDC
jgi:hypothetical protein